MNSLHTSIHETISDLSWLASLSTEPLQSALAYHRYGWHPIPLRSVTSDGACTCPKGATCPRPGKHPLKANWTTPLKENELTELFSKHPLSNIGLLTGFSFWVLDVDGSEGLQTLQQLELSHGPLPQTLRAHTGSGLHLYFQMHDGCSFTNRTRFAPGLDLRSREGQVVAPPSRHARGVDYRYSSLVPLARAPQWLLELGAERVPESGTHLLKTAPRATTPPALPRLSPKERARLYLEKMPPAIQGNGGDKHTLRAACALHNDFDLSEDDSLELLREWNQRCQPPWSDTELRTKVRNAHHYAKSPKGKLVQEVRVPKSTPTASPPATAPMETPPPATHDHSADAPLWENDLLRTNEGHLQKSLDNVALILQHHPAWKGLLTYDEFSDRILLQGPIPYKIGTKTSRNYPREWRDKDDNLTTRWLHRYVNFFVSKDTVTRAIPSVADANASHPVRDYLNNLQWDGTERIATWLQRHLGVADTPYTRVVGSKWLISAIARIHRPGCQADAMLILEGPQGLKKSTALKTLFSEAWFTDRLADIETKDSAIQLQGAWCVELAELDSIRRSAVSSIKAFLTCTTDRYRPPYERHVIEQPRQCVFAGTVNLATYLHDETGARRFWPVTCTHDATLKALAEERDQLWAEALHAYRAGQPWWLESKALEAVAQEEQDARYQSDIWEESIKNYLLGKTEVSIDTILQTVFNLEKGKWSQTDARRVGGCLTRLKWARRQVREGSQRCYKFYAP